MKCNSCGHEQAAGRFCDGCGLKLDPIIVRADPGTAEQPGRPGEQQPLRCTCGHVQNQGRFCDACGIMLSAFRAQPDGADTTARCRQCGGQSSTPICRNCGIPIPGFPGTES